MEDSKQKDLNEESKQAIKQIFDKFDKDNSGQIDYREIKQIAQELGVDVKEEEYTKIFQDLDVNKDNQIDFDEFWAWWNSGRPNKLEKMVYFKLKMSKLLKKAHTNFTRIGGSLDGKYDTDLTQHYGAINYGTSRGNLRIDLQGFLNHPETKDKINNFCDLAQIDNRDEPVILGIKIKAQPGQKDKLVETLQKGVEEIKEFMTSMAPTEFIVLFETIDIKSRALDDDFVLVTLQFDHNLLSASEQNEQIQMVMQYSKIASAFFQINIGLKNSLEVMLQDPEKKFVKTFLEGFLVESKIEMNKAFFDQIRAMVTRKIEKILKKHEENKNIQLKTKKKEDMMLISLLSLLHSSKFHIQFKDIEDIEEFFKGLGLSEIAEDQPCNREFLDEMAEELYYMGPTEMLYSEELPFKKIISSLQEQALADLQVVIVHLNNYIDFSLKAPGLGQIYQEIVMKLVENNKEV